VERSELARGCELGRDQDITLTADEPERLAAPASRTKRRDWSALWTPGLAHREGNQAGIAVPIDAKVSGREVQIGKARKPTRDLIEH
jgi:hypothetical protein